MKSEEEVREKLEHIEKSHRENMRKSGDSPCKPDGSADTSHLAAISSQGYLSALEWVLEEDG